MAKAAAPVGDPLIDVTALEKAATHSYEWEGDRKGILYVGWEHEPDHVREKWRRSVLEPLRVYLIAIGAA